MNLTDRRKNQLDTLRTLGSECAVLLKKDGSFPLKKARNLAVFGSGVRYTAKGGTGSGDVNTDYFVNIEDALTEAGFTVTSKKWLDDYDKIYKRACKDFERKIKKEALDARALPVLYNMGKTMPSPEFFLPLDYDGDAAIYVLTRVSGEGCDRKPIQGDIYLTEAEKRDINVLSRKFKKFMLVLNVCGPVDLSPVMYVGNILLLSQLGSETGHVLADIISGMNYPSGKLGTTWAAFEDYYPLHFGSLDDTNYTEGVYVGYRYFSSAGKNPLFAFGHGLGYTDFELAKGSASFKKGIFEADVTVTNTGNHHGKEVVSLYVSSPKGRIDMPSSALRDFAKTADLKPGESEKLHLSFDIKDCACYDQDMACFMLEPGKYVVSMGNASDNLTQIADISVPEEIITDIKKNITNSPSFRDFVPEKQPGAKRITGIKHYKLEPSDVVVNFADYSLEIAVSEEVKALTNKELIHLAIGEFGKGHGISGAGNASNSVEGAAGETTLCLKEKGLPNLVMADGPAGLRLKDTDCLAIPIGTALAQSWNPEVLYAVGDIIGSEMETKGIDLWLAPAVNIHRSVLCGRNFEYYSEDPLLAGKMAASVTKGVQSHKGRGVTVKHYACNNQETNRYGNCSNVSERALREIYLKPFEICVKEAQPIAIMSSYNLLNGVHTAESEGLLTDALRSEFGFEGIVMGDWVVGGKRIMYRAKDKYKPTSPGIAASAGQNIFMPGCILDYWDIKACLRRKKLSKSKLRENAEIIIRTIKKLKV